MLFPLLAHLRPAAWTVPTLGRPSMISGSYVWVSRLTSNTSHEFHDCLGGEWSSERGRLMSGGPERWICWCCQFRSSWSWSSWTEAAIGGGCEMPLGSIDRRVEGWWWWWWSMERAVRRDSPMAGSPSPLSVSSSSLDHVSSPLRLRSIWQDSRPTTPNRSIPRKILTVPFHKSHHQTPKKTHKLQTNFSLSVKKNRKKNLRTHRNQKEK